MWECIPQASHKLSCDSGDESFLTPCLESQKKSTKREERRGCQRQQKEESKEGISLSVDAICWFSGVHLAATKRRENCFRRFSLVNKAGRYCSNKSFCIPSPGLISPHTIDSVTEISFTLSFSKRNCRPGRISHKKKKSCFVADYRTFYTAS